MSVTEITRSVPLGAVSMFRLVGFVERAVEGFAAWRRARATADTLAGLSDQQLADIGLTRGDIVEVSEALARR